jgi:hypothetical protein
MNPQTPLLDGNWCYTESIKVMTHPALTPAIGRDFDPFLFASIGEDKHGHLLTVISAFARSDLDPWQEAAALARMSRETATARLSKLIAALPREPTWARPVGAIAGDLVALLPKKRDSAIDLPRSLSSVAPTQNARFGWTMCALTVYAVATILLSSHPAPGPERTGRARTLVANTFTVPLPPIVDRRP